tara:strand:+ start:4640 stop:5473 length:834 start_codon:yes stop_codon:yes gene_type:complete
MLTHLSVILTNLAITLLLVGFIWYYFKNKVENLESILNYQSQILKNALQSNTISNNDYLTSNTETNNKINVVLDDEHLEEFEDDEDDDNFEDDEDDVDVDDDVDEDDNDDDDVDNVDDDSEEEDFVNNDVEEEGFVDEILDEVVNEIIDEVVVDDELDNSVKQIKVINLELGNDTESTDLKSLLKQSNIDDNLNINIENVEQKVEENQSNDINSELSYNPLNMKNMETEVTNQEKYSKYTVKQLKEYVLEKDLGDGKNIKNMKKQDLLNLILNNETN